MLAPLRCASRSPALMASRTRLIPIPVSALVCSGDNDSRSGSGTITFSFGSCGFFFGIASLTLSKIH